MKNSFLIAGIVLLLGSFVEPLSAQGPGDSRQGLDPEQRQKLITKFDTDGDGELNEEERQNARQSMRERRRNRSEGFSRRRPGGPEDRFRELRGPGGPEDRFRERRGPGGPEDRFREQRGPGGPEDRFREQRGPGGPEDRFREQRGPGGPEDRFRERRGPGGPEDRFREQRGPGGPEDRFREQRGPRRLERRPPFELKKMFDKFDENGNGSLSREEFQSLTQQVQRMRQKHVGRQRRPEGRFDSQRFGPGVRRSGEGNGKEKCEDCQKPNNSDAEFSIPAVDEPAA